MSYYKCHDCKKIITLTNKSRKPNDKIYYHLCRKCITKYDFISKTEGKKRYILNDNDLESLM